ncbi:MAG: response regulator transcription factor [Bacteroidetes bacterium]|nr:response regulator transcription factor [Bacteroidota bacterium]MCL5027002.1 response regulator transcription factor [Chloroflexota bacterium]
MRILLADDQPEVRSALRLLLEQEAGLEVVAEAGEAACMLALLEAVHPDLLLLDWELPGLDASLSRVRTRRAMLSSLRALCPGLSVVTLSGRPEVRRAALAAGADAFVSKGDPPEHLLATLRGIDVGGVVR